VSGLLALAFMVATSVLDIVGLSPSFSNLVVPPLPLLPVVGILLALLPVLVAATPSAGKRSATSPIPNIADRAATPSLHKASA
jgi:hypothetical protein